jgi:hypothetical protein
MLKNRLDKPEPIRAGAFAQAIEDAPLKPELRDRRCSVELPFLRSYFRMIVAAGSTLCARDMSCGDWRSLEDCVRFIIGWTFKVRFEVNA